MLAVIRNNLRISVAEHNDILYHTLNFTWLGDSERSFKKWTVAFHHIWVFAVNSVYSGRRGKKVDHVKHFWGQIWKWIYHFCPKSLCLLMCTRLENVGFLSTRKISCCSGELCLLIHMKQGSVKKEIGSCFMETIDSLTNRRYLLSAAMFHALCLDARNPMALSKRAWTSGPETPDPLLPLWTGRPSTETHPGQGINVKWN